MRAIAAVTTPGETAALCHSVGLARASFYRRRRPTPSLPPPPSRAPSPRALAADERQAMLDTLHSERFVDQSPAEVHATLLEEQTYLGSVRTMYRVLAEAHEVRERRAQARHPVYTKPELVATGPNQVWSWDITKLKGPIPYLYYSLYVILDLLDLVRLLIDGVHVGGHCIVVALGIDKMGAKHPLGLWEGATENATVCQGLLTNLASRGLRTDRSLLVIVDGAKALDTAVTQTFGRAALVQRCQVHKGRNILEHLPEAQRPWVKAVLTRAYTNSPVKTAKRLLQDLARRLDTDYPSAATSVREGLDETLTVLGLGLSERLQRSLATTNAIESLLSRTRHVQRHVKRWRGGTMVLRWVAAGVLEAAKGFRRVQGCQDMPALVAALRARDARLRLGESSEMVA